MKSFLVQPFHQRVHLATEVEECVTKYNKHCGQLEKMTVKELQKCRGMAIHLDESKPLFMIYVPHDVSHGTLFHECLHMTHFIMQFSSAPITLESTEIQAYMMENIAENIRKKLK